MALTPTEEALVRQLLNQQAAILSLAGKESTITSKLGATKVTLANLVAASSVADADLLLTRQGTTDKSVRADILAAYMGAELGALFAPIASPALTGTPTVPTATAGTNTTQIASTAFVQSAVGVAISAGAVLGFAMAAAPTGWLKCNGAAVSRTTYAKLFAAIGTTFGAGNGSATFNLPDLRGEFIRGFDDGRGVDPGRALGSAQGDAIRNITGYIRSTNGAFTTEGATGAFAAIQQGQRASNDAGYVGYSGLTLDASLVVPTANENRPRNVAMLMCIKY